MTSSHIILCSKKFNESTYENALEEAIEFRKEKLFKGEVTPESKTLEINKLQSLEFLKSSNMDKEEFYSKVDYKLREMKFYNSALHLLMGNLKTYGLLIYQYIKYNINSREE